MAEVEVTETAETSRARRRPESLEQLGLDIRVPALGSSGHVQHTFPDLIAPVGTRRATTLEQRLELGRQRVGDEYRHRSIVPAAPTSSGLAPARYV